MAISHNLYVLSFIHYLLFLGSVQATTLLALKEGNRPVLRLLHLVRVCHLPPLITKDVTFTNNNVMLQKGQHNLQRIVESARLSTPARSQQCIASDQLVYRALSPRRHAIARIAACDPTPRVIQAKSTLHSSHKVVSLLGANSSQETMKTRCGPSLLKPPPTKHPTISPTVSQMIAMWTFLKRSRPMCWV